MKFVLASASPRRKELISHLKIPFTIETSDIDEQSDHLDPVKFCLQIAEEKGRVIFNRHTDDCFVVSADTIVCLNGKIYGKPKDREEAKNFLNELGGKTHSVFTAVVIHLRYSDHNSIIKFVEESRVTFNVITPDLMERYLATGDSLDKAGAYGIQGPSLTFISKVEGDYANVVGFPLSRFIQECRNQLGSQWLNIFSS
jgi:septum formation protein